jgi:hypothetical protein
MSLTNLTTNPIFLKRVLTDQPGGDGFCYLRFRNCRRGHSSEDLFYVTSQQSATNNVTEFSALSLEGKAFEQIDEKKSLNILHNATGLRA